MSAFDKIDFVVIGPGRSGTSWIYTLLKQHPEICLSSSKETLYFEVFYDKGEEWFHHFFKPSNPNQLLGEISNTYIFNQPVAQRLKDYRQDIKLIASLRSPVDRIFSHYLYMLKVGEEQGTFDEVLAKRPGLIRAGKYAELIADYDAFFNKNQMLFLLFEDLKKDPHSYARQIFDFLRIKHIFLEEEAMSEKVLPAGKARNAILSGIVSKLAHWAREAGYADLVSKVKFNKNITRYLYKEYREGEKPQLRPDQKEHLKSLFYEDVERLSERLQKDMIQYWNF